MYTRQDLKNEGDEKETIEIIRITNRRKTEKTISSAGEKRMRGMDKQKQLNKEQSIYITLLPNT